MLLEFGYVVIGLVGLFFGGEFVVSAASRLARSFGIPSVIVGLTVVSFGTSLPELLVSMNAALTGSSGIAIGNVVGSNIANIGLILGLAALVFPVGVDRALVRREIPIMIIASLLFVALMQDGIVSFTDGLLLFVGLIVFMIGMVWEARHDTRDLDGDGEPDLTVVADGTIPRGRALLRLVIGCAILALGARLTVDGAVGIARGVGISELVIGVTLVAVGTSLPELAASVIAAVRKESDIAIGNVVGSNIFNILSIIGITALIQPIPVQVAAIQRDLLIMLAFTLVLVPMVLNFRIGRSEAALLLIGYIAFIIVAFLG